MEWLRTERPMTGSARKRSKNGRRSSSTPVAKRIRAIAACAAASDGPRAGVRPRGRPPAAPSRRAPARRRSAAAAAARRRGGAAARPSTRRSAGTAMAAEPRRGPRPRSRVDLAAARMAAYLISRCRAIGTWRATGRSAGGSCGGTCPGGCVGCEIGHQRFSRWTSIRNEFDATMSPSDDRFRRRDTRVRRGARRPPWRHRRRSRWPPARPPGARAPAAAKPRSTAVAATTGRPSTISPSSSSN